MNTYKAQHRRDAIRRTWAMMAVKHAPRTVVRFFLGQPPAAHNTVSVYGDAYALLQV